jgi:hypothetical protein
MMVRSRLGSLWGALGTSLGSRWREWRAALGWVVSSWWRPAGASSHWEQRVAKKKRAGRRVKGAGEGIQGRLGG